MVRMHFQKTPWDLFVVTGYTLVSAGLVLGLGIGSWFAALLIIFAPGYAIVAFLFPGDEHLNWIERIGLSAGLSIVVIPFLGLVLGLTPIGIWFESTVAIVAAFTLLTAVAAYWRRMQLDPESRLRLTIEFTGELWRESGNADKVLTVALGICLFIAVSALAYFVFTPLRGESYTEFYLVGSGGNATGYPTTLNVSQKGSVTLGIVNHEFSRVAYAIRADLVGVRILYNVTTSWNETIEVNRTTWSWMNITTSDGQRWTGNYTFSIGMGGLWKVQFLLFKGGAPTAQTLHFYVTIV